MSILFHVTAPPPRLPGTDAVFQEIEALQSRFGGELNYLYPFKKPGRPLPPRFFGLHNVISLRAKERDISLHHVFANAYHPFPVLRFLRKPVIYTVVASVQNQRPQPADTSTLAHTIVVTNRRDLTTLETWGFANVKVIRPAIDTTHFINHAPSGDGAFTLLAGSAPWVKQQFRDKGFDALFEVMRDVPDLRLILLWRGLLVDELQQRLRRMQLADRVDVVNRKADVSELLQRAHAAVVLANKPQIIKSYPHSLIESLAAGRPVLLSQCIPMSDYVEEKGCGEVVDDVDPTSLRESIQKLRDDYDAKRAQAVIHGKPDFSIDGMLEQYGALYRNVESVLTA